MESENKEIIVTEVKQKKKFNFKEYYANNKEFREKTKEKANRTVVCECGRVVNKSSLSTHKKSPVHRKAMTIKNPEV